jgi:hypothetical protein
MKKNTLICAIEYALHDDGCNEITLDMLLRRVGKFRGCANVSRNEIEGVLAELVQDGLYEVSGPPGEMTDDTLVNRSQSHPSVPYDGPILL